MHVSAKYHLNPVFPSLCRATETPEKTVEKAGTKNKKKKKKTWQPLKGIPSGDGMPQWCNTNGHVATDEPVVYTEI